MSEHAHQCALIEWWKIAHKAYGLPERALFAIPNGGARHIAVAGKLKAEGVRKGVVDLHLPVPRGGYTGLWVEMKYGKGKVSPEQVEFIAFVEAQGGKCVVCWDWMDAAEAIRQYLGMKQPERITA